MTEETRPPLDYAGVIEGLIEAAQDASEMVSHIARVTANTNTTEGILALSDAGRQWSDATRHLLEGIKRFNESAAVSRSNRDRKFSDDGLS